ncbi:Uncharacterized protein TCM_016309 [Theobroma cacao]|uniref:RNase H type-1 domain-containing protein n=1 Tax=Theobroma cacao TaxID=3641 RepID=A0A061G4N4_THECC|nr:Uncharacterized protein TCM_016309 [Theobroma cacao]
MAAPKQGYIKFNVDGSAKGCFGPMRIGEILRNEFKELKINFSKSIVIILLLKVMQLTSLIELKNGLWRRGGCVNG